ncbi:MAG TPA: hypothetical protein VL175_16395 [Pirellulales bacterium]|nr:hypothetical protein [Pirellulales bacterium]
MTHLLEQKIGQVRRRARWLLVLYAFGFTFGVLALVILVLGTADYWIRFRDPGIRLFCSLAVAAALGWSVYRFWFLAFGGGWSDGRIAGRIERFYPQLKNRLASALEFANARDADPTAGSAELRRALVENTTAIGESLDFSRALDWTPAWRAMRFGGILLLVVATFAFMAPESTRTALVRLARPLGHDDWPRYYNLAFRSPPTRLAVGQPFEVELVRDAEHRVPDSVRIFYGYGQSVALGELESEEMTFLAGTMTARKDRVTRPFWYRAEGGDDSSMEWIRLEVVEPPRVESLELSLHPPAYSALPVSSTENNLHALRGTRVQVDGSSNKRLRKASIRLENGDEVNLPLSADGYGFSLAADAAAPFVIEQSGSYAIALEDAQGLVGGLEQRYEIQAIADQAPTVTIEQPLGNVFITPSGQVPLKIVAKDDLEIASLSLRYSNSGSDEVEDASLPLYQGPEGASGRAAAPVTAAQSGSGESRTIEYRWSTADLGLKPGAQMTFWATATDYLPQTGKSTPRKINVITPAELEERLAQRQSLVFGELQRVLKLQQDTRAQTRGLEIQLDQVGSLNKQDLDHAQSAELNQRQVARSLTSPDEGVRAQVAEFLNDLDNNRIDSPDIERHMKSLLSEIERLDNEHLTPVERDLTGLIKAAQAKLPEAAPAGAAKPKADSALQTPLKHAAGHQDQVIDSLEHVLRELGQWESYRRFARGVAQMQRDQEQTSAATKELAQKTIGREFKDLDAQQQADLKKISAQQSELSRRLERFQQQMAETSRELRQADPLSSATIEDALHQAQKQAISAQMRQSAERLERNQLGQAVEEQSKIARDLDELAGILSSRKEQELARLVKQLRDAERELERLHSEQRGLRKRARELAQEPDEQTKKTELERLAREQKQLEEETARLARRLERLQAEKAGAQGARAADKMRQAQAAGEQGDGDAAGDQAAAAEKDLEEAQQKLAERRKQAEQDLAHEQMARLDDSLKSLHERQQKLVDETRRLEELRAESGRFNRAQLGTLHGLSREQQSMEGETSGIAEKLEAAEVIHLALTGAAKQMSRAAELLTHRQTGTATQVSQEAARDRLARLLAAMRDDKRPKPNGNQSQEGEGGEQSGGKTRADGNEVLTQLKLLKLLQEDLNARFSQLGPQSPDTQSRASELAELAVEQGKLAELVFKLAEPPADHPEDSPELLPDVREQPPERDPADVPDVDEEEVK